MMTESTPTPEDFLGNPEPAIWAEVERYATQSNDEHSAALLSLRARVEQLEANAKPTPTFDQIRSSGITPPPELVQQLCDKAILHAVDGAKRGEIEVWLIQEAFRAGADAELEACCERQALLYGNRAANELRAARRPKPPSLKEQALQEVDALEGMGTCNIDTIRRALEELND